MTIGFIDPSFIPEERERYQKWIDDNVPKEPDKVRGLCRKMSEEFVKEFPEFRIVGYVGHYGQHCWCVDKEERVIDPTWHQYGQHPKRIIHPKNKEEGRLELADFPTGKCMNCGELCYGGRTVICSEECEKDFRGSL